MMPAFQTAPLQTETSGKNILVVEDEQPIREMIAEALSQEGYAVFQASDGLQGIDFFLSQGQIVERKGSPIDLLILDTTLPHISGLDLCHVLRRQGINIPILIVSAGSSETDRVVGLEVGADDYLNKPFSIRELVARCRALLRYAQGATPRETKQILHHKGIILDLHACQARRGDKVISLARKEFLLLELFMTHPKRVWSREQLIDRVWGEDFLGDTKTVDVHIRWLREKLEDNPSDPQLLITIRGFGYRLN